MNALPLKNQMKNVYRGNQIFTKFYLPMCNILQNICSQVKSMSITLMMTTGEILSRIVLD